jgi:adenosylcobyric acid synthase
LDLAIRGLAARSTAIVGICGGYQMLGWRIHDPNGVESPSRLARGLGLLSIETTFAQEKATCQVRARVHGGQTWAAALGDVELEAYEIHMGRTKGEDTDAGWLRIVQRNGSTVDVPDGAMSEDGKVWGCYLHGLFANAPLREAWLNSLNGKRDVDDTAPKGNPLDNELDRLADAVAAAIDMEQIYSILSTPLSPYSGKGETNNDNG